MGFGAAVLLVTTSGEDLPPRDVGALICKQGLLGGQHVFHTGGQGLGLSSPESPIWGFLH